MAGLGKLSYKLGVTAMETLRKVYTTMEEHHTSIMGRCDATQTPHSLPPWPSCCGWARERGGAGPYPRADHGLVVGNGRTPHWFIWYFGSDPNCAGQGHGGALMEKVLEEVDKSELPAYTECTDDKHKPFFQKYGFNVEEYHEQPTLSYMLRPANKGGGAAAGGGGGGGAAPEPAPARGAMPSAMPADAGISRPVSPERKAEPAPAPDEDSDDDAI